MCTTEGTWPICGHLKERSYVKLMCGLVARPLPASMLRTLSSDPKHWRIKLSNEKMWQHLEKIYFYIYMYTICIFTHIYKYLHICVYTCVYMCILTSALLDSNKYCYQNSTSRKQECTSYSLRPRWEPQSKWESNCAVARTVWKQMSILISLSNWHRVTR